MSVQLRLYLEHTTALVKSPFPFIPVFPSLWLLPCTVPFIIPLKTNTVLNAVVFHSECQRHIGNILWLALSSPVEKCSSESGGFYSVSVTVVRCLSLAVTVFTETGRDCSFPFGG